MLATHADAYRRGLQAYTSDRLADWLDTFGWAVQKASRRSEVFATEVAKLQDTWRARAGHPRRRLHQQAAPIAGPRARRARRWEGSGKSKGAPEGPFDVSNDFEW